MTEDERLKELVTLKKKNGVYDVRKKLLEEKRNVAERKMFDCKDAMEAEQGDVDKLEGKSLKNAILSATGKMEEKMEKEVVEATAAEEAYEAAVKEWEAAKEELRQVIEKENDRRRAEAEYEKLLQERIAYYKDNDEEKYKVIANHQAIISACEERLKKANAAIKVGMKAKGSASSVLTMIREVEDSAVTDMFVDHVSVDIYKHSMMDKVRNRVKALSVVIAEFNKEASYVKVNDSIRVNNSIRLDNDAPSLVMDAIFDNFFVNIAFFNSVSETESEVSRVLGRISESVCALQKVEAMEKEFLQKASEEFENAFLELLD